MRNAMIENVELSDRRLITRLLGNNLVHNGNRWCTATTNVINITAHSNKYPNISDGAPA